MSRLPRHLERLKTSFTTEAVSAAMYRAFAEQAEAEDKPNLAARWRHLAEEKDHLAIRLLRAAGKVGTEERNVKTAIAEEQYQNEVLYPKLIADLEHLGQEDEETLLREVVEIQGGHLSRLVRLRKEITASPGDLDSASPDEAAE